MATPTGTVRLHENNREITFQVLGWGRMQQSLPVRRLGEKGLSEAGSRILVDLRHCTYLDSTFLGTLLYLKRASLRHGDGKFLLVSPSIECCRLFKQLGIEDCFSVTTADEPAGSWTVLPCQPDDIEEFNANVVQAHEELANLDGSPGKAFHAVSKSLNKDWEDRNKQ